MKLLCIDDSPTCFLNCEHYVPPVEILGTYNLKYSITVMLCGEWTEVYVLEEFGDHYFYDPSRFIPLTENINV